MDSEDLEVQIELEKHGLSDLPEELRIVQGVEDSQVDKLNTDTARQLEKCAKAAEDRVKIVHEIYPHGVGQNPKLTKYKLPVIDDLVTPDIVSRLHNKCNIPK